MLYLGAGGIAAQKPRLRGIAEPLQTPKEAKNSEVSLSPLKNLDLKSVDKATKIKSMCEQLYVFDRNMVMHIKLKVII